MHHLGPQVHCFHNLAAAALHRLVFKELSHPVEQHHAHRLRVFSNEEGADGGNGHQKVFIKNMPPHQIFCRSGHNLPAQHHIGQQAHQQGAPSQAGLSQHQPQYKQSAAQGQFQHFPVFGLMNMAVLMIFRVLLLVVGTAAAFPMTVMVAAPAAFLVLMMVTAPAAFLVVMVVTAPAAFLVVMMVTAPAAFLMIMMVTAAALRFGGASSISDILSGRNHHPRLNAPGNLGQFPDQAVRVFRRQPKLPGSKGNHGLLHLRMAVEFAFYFRRTVGAIQILNGVDLLCHTRSSLRFCFNI